jgi:hypothetical protein
MSLMGAFYRSRPSRKGRLNNNAEHDVVATTAERATFPKSVPDLVFPKLPTRHGKTGNALAGRIEGLGTVHI